MVVVDGTFATGYCVGHLLLAGFGLLPWRGAIYIWGLFFLVAIPIVLLGLVVLVMAIFFHEPKTIR